MNLEAMFTLHADMPRQGPGSTASTKKALALLGDLGPASKCLDLGCGPGAQSLVLAAELGGPVTAVDFHQPFLDQLDASAKAQGLDHLITTRLGDMAELPDPPGSYDLIWAEGSIYLIGFEKGLKQWSPILAPGGAIGVTEATWLVGDPPEPAREFWQEGYPAMTDVAGNLAIIEKAGLEVVGHFALPGRDWWDQYYDPLAARMELLAPQAANDPDLAAVIEENRVEMELHRAHGDSYGYVFYLMRAGS